MIMIIGASIVQFMLHIIQFVMIRTFWLCIAYCIMFSHELDGSRSYNLIPNWSHHKTYDKKLHRNEGKRKAKHPPLFLMKRLEVIHGLIG